MPSDDTNFMQKYFNEREKMMKKWDKSMLIFQCGKFYEIYGYQDDLNDQIWEYQKIMPNCAEPWNKCKLNNRNVVCCGWPTDKFFKWIHLFVPGGWKLDVWNETGEKKIGSRKVKIHGFFKSFSPGTFVPIENKSILSNNCSCIWIEKSYDYVKQIPHLWVGMSVINSISGKSKLYEYKFVSNNLFSTAAFEELDKFNAIHNPKEIWLIHNIENNKIEEIKSYANLYCNRINIYSMEEKHEHSDLIKNCNFQKFQKDIMNQYFNPKDSDTWFYSYGFNEKYYSVASYCVLLKFMHLHNPELIEKLLLPEIETLDDKLILRTHSLQQLNIIDTEINSGPYSSINKLLNKCKTDMGKREFKNLLVNPTNNIESLNKDYDMIDHILLKYDNVTTFRNELKMVSDIERLYRKFILNNTEPIDIAYLYNSFVIISKLNDIICKDDKFKSYIDFKINHIPNQELIDLIYLLESTFKIDVCKRTTKLKEESFFQRGLYKDLDKEEDNWENININLNNYKELIETIIGKEDTTQIWKIQNEIFLRTTKTRAKKFMDFKNKTTILNNIKTKSCGESKMKFVSHELNTLYDNYVQSSDNFIELLNCKFKQFIRKLKEKNNEINLVIKYATIIDIIINKAFVSKKYNYCKPIIRDAEKSFFDIKKLRHPLIEHLQTQEVFVPNDISLGRDPNGILLYGTNGCGKSSIIRAIGNSIIMAQSGMYVPCESFIYKPYDTIFTRILGNDNLFKGLSAFSTEMSEFQCIEEFSNKNSLVLGDELCSGTEHPSAISIFTSGLVGLNKKKSSYIFATHLHELEDIPEIKAIQSLAFKHMSVEYDEEKQLLIYERKLKNGRGRANYGLEVCKQYNFSKEFFDIAYRVRNRLLNEKFLGDNKTTHYNSSLLKNKCEMPGCNNDGDEVHHLEPQEKADRNGFIEHFHKNHKGNLINICYSCHKTITKNKTIYKKTKTSKGQVLVKQ